MSEITVVDKYDRSQSSKTAHMRLVSGMLEECGFCFVLKAPCINVDGSNRFGWDEVNRAMLRMDPCSVQRTRNEAISTLKYLGEEATVADPRYIEFKNCILDIKSMASMSSDEFQAKNLGVIPVVIPHDYDERVTPDQDVEKLLDGVSCNDPDIRRNIEEMMGLCISRYADSRSAAAWMPGSGGNGKSTLIDAIAFMVGYENVSYLMLEEVSDKFSTQGIVNKLVNVSDDTPAGAIDKGTIAILKKIVHGNCIKAEQKGKDPFEFKPFCTMLITSNEPPRLSDTTYGSMRRFHIVPLMAKFDKANGSRDIDLADKLKTERAAQWMIKLAIDGLRRVLDNEGMSENRWTISAAQETKERSNSVFAFLSDHPRAEFEVEPNVELWYWQYQDYAKNAGEKPFSQTQFSTFVCTEYGFKTNNNGRYSLDYLPNEAKVHGKVIHDKFRKFVDK